MRALMRAAGEDEAAISVTLVNDDAIQAINREHRGKDKPTDVLSFPFHAPHERAPKISKGAATSSARPQRAKPAGSPEPEHHLGDIVISVDTARRQASDYDAPLQSEIYRLLIHGLLHVLGHDHEEAGERARMEREERRLADAIGMPWPYDK